MGNHHNCGPSGIKGLKEFDAKLFKEITGIDVDKLEDKVKVECEGKTVMLSRESAKALNLI